LKSEGVTIHGDDVSSFCGRTASLFFVVERTESTHGIIHRSMTNPKEEQGEEQGWGIAIEEGHPVPKEPPRYAVFLNNDDYTTMDFVVEVLRRFFQRSEEEAVQIMLQIHQKGRGVAGIYHFEIAETKATQVLEYARSKGFPLNSYVEPVLE